MKRPNLFFTAILVPLDAITIFAAAIMAYNLRLTDFFTQLRPVTFQLTLETYTNLAAIAVLFWLIIFSFMGVYRAHQRTIARELSQVLFASASAMAVILAFLFFSLEAFDSRFIVLAGWLLAVLFLWVERLVIRGIQRSLLFIGVGMRHVAIIGSDESARILRETYDTKRRFGVEVVATYIAFTKKTEQDLRKYARSGRVDEIILTDSDIDRKTLNEIKLFTDANHIGLRYSADLFSVGSLRMDASAVSGIPLVTVRKTPLDGWGAIYKRGFDIIGSLVLIVLTSPIMLLTIIITLIDSGLPILFKNGRVGERGEKFKTLKFRSMKAEYSIGSQKGLGNQAKAKKLEEELIKKYSRREGPLYKILEDPRVTAFGRFIRKYSIDELPQLFNILVGEMSLVGPRPHQPREVAKYTPAQRKVLNVKPGLSGLAQISGRADLDFDDEVRLDTFYIENWSPWLDFVILIKTPFIVLFRKGAV